MSVDLKGLAVRLDVGLRKTEESRGTPRCLTWATRWMTVRCSLRASLLEGKQDKAKGIDHILGVLSFRGLWATQGETSGQYLAIQTCICFLSLNSIPPSSWALIYYLSPVLCLVLSLYLFLIFSMKHISHTFKKHVLLSTRLLSQYISPYTYHISS